MWLYITGILVLACFSCEQITEEVIPDNDAFSTSNVSRIKIENYVNRLYIDILSREPTDLELQEEADRLNEAELSEASRLSLIEKLMSDTTLSPGEGSYKQAYTLTLYNLAKIRCLEGAADAVIQQYLGIAKGAALRDSLNGNWESYYASQITIRNYELLLQSKNELFDGNLKYHQVYAFMINNGVYDIINMNSFNFIRASFDELLFRLPTSQEYDAAFDMVEKELPSFLFGQEGASKNDYVDIIIHSEAMLSGMLDWSFQVFLNRPATAQERAGLLPGYIANQDINQLIAQILSTDEYANFR